MVKIFLPLFCYLIGSIPTGFLIAVAHGIDIQKIGSGNIGATNVTRALGWKWGGVTFAIDFAKAALAVWLTAISLKVLGGRADAWIALAGIAVLLGNCYPITLRFRGGKGIATSFGIFLPIAPTAVLTAALAYGMVFAITRISALGSLTAMAFLLLSVASFPPSSSLSYLYMALFTTVLVLFRHRKNIVQILQIGRK